MPPGTPRNTSAKPNGMQGAAIAPVRSATAAAMRTASMKSPIGLQGPCTSTLPSGRMMTGSSSMRSLNSRNVICSRRCFMLDPFTAVRSHSTRWREKPEDDAAKNQAWPVDARHRLSFRGVAASRCAGGRVDGFEHFLRVAQTAEAAMFDMVFLADGIGIRGVDKPPGSLCRSEQNAELEPLTLLSALAVVTRAYRAGGDGVDDLQRAVSYRAQVRLAGPYQRRAGRVEHRHVLVRQRGAQLQPRPASWLRDAL